MKLGNLIYFYDDNEITIEGKTELAFSENVAQRFQAYGWQTISIDGHNHDEIRAAIRGREKRDRQTEPDSRQNAHCLPAARIKHDTSGAHGSPLGVDEVKLTKEALNWAC